jgi:hypothetical protein
VARVTITGNGRSGRVEYAEGWRTISGCWEFGGDDIVAIVDMGSREQWRRAHRWAIDTRPGILRVVADEVIRQQAPACMATIDEEHGTILIGPTVATASGSPTPSPPRLQAGAFVHRLRDLKPRMALGVLAATLIVGASWWLVGKATSVTSATGSPLNHSLRFDSAGSHPAGIATLIQTADARAIELSGRGGQQTSSIGILITPLDGSAPRLVAVRSRIPSNAPALARIIGSDGQTVWFDVMGLHGVRLADDALIHPSDLRAANPDLDPSWWEDPRGMEIRSGRLHVMRIDRSAAIDVDPETWSAAPTVPTPSAARFLRREPADFMAAGLLTTATTWLGLHSAAERAGRFKPGRWIDAVESAEGGRVTRQLSHADLDSGQADRYRVRSIAPLSDTAYLEAAFLRFSDGVPIRLAAPDSALMIHTSAPGGSGTLVLARVRFDGHLLWTRDTGLDRFSLQQILPGADAVAFIGTRPPVPTKLSEPLLVWVEGKTGAMTVHSLWR